MAKGKRHPMEGENLPIRNSTAEFLTFVRESDADTIAVRFQDEMLWLTLSLIGELFDVAKSTVSEYLSNIFASGEWEASATVRKYRTVRQEGSRQVEREQECYICYKSDFDLRLDWLESQARKEKEMEMNNEFTWAKSGTTRCV